VKLKRCLSRFSVLRKGSGEDSEEPFPFGEEKMEKAAGMLAQEADNINEDDPRQAAQVMRKLTEMTGLKMGKGMQEAIKRMEAGEDPEKIEEEMEDFLEEEPFVVSEKKRVREESRAPHKDITLYELQVNE